MRLPIRGLAGAVIQTNSAINIADAYQDRRFDATMDRRTGYRTRQILGVPLRHPLTKEAVGLLQVNNRLDGSFEGFPSEAQRVLELACEQLSELLHGRADVFIHSGGVGEKDNSIEHRVLLYVTLALSLSHTTLRYCHCCCCCLFCSVHCRCSKVVRARGGRWIGAAELSGSD